MPLTWDATEVRDFDTLTDDERVTLNSLIFASMPVGIQHITEDNAREFYARVSFWEKVNGAYRMNEDGDVPFTADDVRRFIGLRTNVSTITAAQFRKNVWEAHDRWNVRF